LRASSPIGVADSKPMNARIANTMPLKIPVNVPSTAFDGLNVCSVRSPRLESSIHADSATNTPISKIPRMTPACVDRRTSR
jgi:hypothetical protein